jgi:hypothetical protein
LSSVVSNPKFSGSIYNPDPCPSILASHRKTQTEAYKLKNIDPLIIQVLEYLLIKRPNRGVPEVLITWFKGYLLRDGKPLADDDDDDDGGGETISRQGSSQGTLPSSGGLAASLGGGGGGGGAAPAASAATTTAAAAATAAAVAAADAATAAALLLLFIGGATFC